MQHRYAELHCKTNFSFLQGASHADELVARAAELGYHALAVTDVNSLAGVVRAHAAAKTAGIKLIIGAEITFDTDDRLRLSATSAQPTTPTERVLLYATSFKGYGNLSSLITRGRRKAKKGECHLVFDDLADFAEDLIAAKRHIPQPLLPRRRPSSWAKR